MAVLQKETFIAPRTLVVGIHAPYNTTRSIESYYKEFLNLIKTNRVIFHEALFMKLRTIDSAFFFTKGKLHELKELCDRLEIEEVIFSEPLTPQQERNISNFLHCRTYDRTQLILEIFEKAAHSAEGKLQVAIAMLQHQKSRLAGRGVHLAQQRGGIGLRGGPGETAKEKESRYLEEYILKYKKQLKQLEQTRSTQRKKRLQSGIPLFCLIGYTNAGKSTLLNALTHSNVLAEDQLFATLDTTTRELYINNQKVALLSDTVGFIQQLPARLIDAFKSTLSELQHADLLLHVVDISDPNWTEHIDVVHDILEDLNIDSDMIYIFNKADKASHSPLTDFSLELYKPHIVISAHESKDLTKLQNMLLTWTDNKCNN